MGAVIRQSLRESLPAPAQSGIIIRNGAVQPPSANTDIGPRGQRVIIPAGRPIRPARHDRLTRPGVAPYVRYRTQREYSANRRAVRGIRADLGSLPWLHAAGAPARGHTRNTRINVRYRTSLTQINVAGLCPWQARSVLKGPVARSVPPLEGSDGIAIGRFPCGATSRRTPRVPACTAAPSRSCRYQSGTGVD
jgi:hypothetical protein